MNLQEAIKARHSVRAYKNQPLTADIKDKLNQLIAECNREGNLHLQLITDEPKAFDSTMAHYGKFANVSNYIALIGKKSPQLDQMCGYYGEKIVLYAQQLGLNTCWVALTYKKIPQVLNIGNDEKLRAVIALGYGQNQGVAHKSKSMQDVTKIAGTMPQWFKNGVEAALLAPTAMNQQKFSFQLDGNTVTAKAGMGFYSKIDLGIVKYHFELGAGAENFQWK